MISLRVSSGARASRPRGESDELTVGGERGQRVQEGARVEPNELIEQRSPSATRQQDLPYPVPAQVAEFHPERVGPVVAGNVLGRPGSAVSDLDGAGVAQFPSSASEPAGAVSRAGRRQVALLLGGHDLLGQHAQWDTSPVGGLVQPAQGGVR